MVKIEGLKDRLLTANKREYPTVESTYGYQYVEALGQMNNATGNEKIQSYILGEKILNAESVELDNDELKLLKRAIETMKIMGEGIRAHVYFQLLKKITEPGSEVTK